MNMILTWVNPGLVLILAGLFAFALPLRRVRQGFALLGPVLGIIFLSSAPQDTDIAVLSALGLDLVLFRVDGLNFLFALGFLIGALVHSLYALHQDDRLQDGMALVCAGAAISAVLAGDLMTLFVFWELTAASGIFLILRARTRASYFGAMRFFALQVLSGVLLLDGVAYVYKYSGDIGLDAFADLDDPGAIYIFAAIGIKAAFPLLNNWMQDSFPKATVSGAVVLSGLTGLVACYAALRLLPGFEGLIWIGMVMAVLPLVFIVLESDLRRVLAYGLNAHLGFIICAIGCADLTSRQGLAVANGAVAHSFVTALAFPLLFMAIGAVLYRTGTAREGRIGGLSAQMPLTALMCVLGAACVSGVPFFAGYVSLDLLLDGVATNGVSSAAPVLAISLAGTTAFALIKVVYAAFFQASAWDGEVEEAPFNMVLAMGTSAAILLLIGVPPFLGLGYDWLYQLLPGPSVAASASPFAPGAVLGHIELLVFSALGYILLTRFGVLPRARASTVIDTDWIYRRLGYGFAVWCGDIWKKAGPALASYLAKLVQRAFDRIEAAFSPRGRLSQGPLSGGMAIWTGALLCLAMILSFATVR